MKNSRINILIFIFLAVLAYGATRYFDAQTPQSSGIIAQPPAPSEVASGEIVPEFSFTTIDGQTHNIREFKGRVVLLNFWATWCPPCIKEFPELLKLAAENPDKVTLIALSSDIDPKAVETFLKKQTGVTENVHIAIDENMLITQKMFQTYKLPETIIIDSNQKMKEKIAGADWDPAYLQNLVTKAY